MDSPYSEAEAADSQYVGQSSIIQALASPSRQIRNFHVLQIHPAGRTRSSGGPVLACGTYVWHLYSIGNHRGNNWSLFYIMQYRVMAENFRKKSDVLAKFHILCINMGKITKRFIQLGHEMSLGVLKAVVPKLFLPPFLKIIFCILMYFYTLSPQWEM